MRKIFKKHVFFCLKNLGEDPDSGHLARPARVWTMAYSSNRESLYRGGKGHVAAGLSNHRGQRVIWAWVLWPPYALGTRTEL